MLGDIRCGAYQGFVAYLADFHGIVRYQTVSALYQLKRRFGFTDTTFTCNQHAFAVYIHQYAVYGNTGRQFDIQPADSFRHEYRCILFGGENRSVIFMGYFKENRIRLQLAAEYHTGNIIGHQFVVYHPLLFFADTFHISIFHKTDNLQTGRVEMLEITCHLQCRSVYIRHGDLDALDVNIRSQIFQLKLFHNLFHFYACHTHTSLFIIPSFYDVCCS